MHMRDLFDHFDCHGRGEVDAEELRRGTVKLGKTLTRWVAAFIAIGYHFRKNPQEELNTLSVIVCDSHSQRRCKDFAAIL